MSTKNILVYVTPSSPGRFAGIAGVAKAHGWHLTMVDRLTHSLSGWNGDGALVTLRDDESVLHLVRSLRRQKIPVVDLTVTRPEIRLPRVAGDNAAIGRLAAWHFAERNFRHARWFSTSWGHQHKLRRDAFSASFQQGEGRSFDTWAWSLDPAATHTDDWRALSRWLKAKIEKAPKPLAIFSFDDADASFAESITLSAGFRIPDDVAILGAGDDAPLCDSQSIPISSVHHDLEAIGRAGAELLAGILEGASAKPKTTLVPPTGISERASTQSLAAYSPIVAKAIEIYKGRLRRAPSTPQLADELGVSRPTLDRAFAADMGMSPAAVLRSLRLSEAKRRLAAGQNSISEIAYSLGFCNPAHFSNVFRAETGVPPRNWEKRIGSG